MDQPMPTSRRGSNSPMFDKEWSVRYDKCTKGVRELQHILLKVDASVKKYGSIEDSLVLRKHVERMISETVEVISKLSIDIIELSDIVDKELDLSVEEINNFDKYEFETISPKLISKKKAEMKMAKQFKDTVVLFKHIQTKAVEKAKEFVLKAKDASKRTARRDQFMKKKIKSAAELLEADIVVEQLPDHLTELPVEECQVFMENREKQLVRMETDLDKMKSVVIELDHLEQNQSSALDRLERKNSKYGKETSFGEDFKKFISKNYCWIILAITAGIVVILIVVH
jgi:hypothetical protein